MQIGLFYGSTTCYTEMAAEKIQDIIGKDTLSMFNIKDVNLKEAEKFLTYTVRNANIILFQEKCNKI